MVQQLLQVFGDYWCICLACLLGQNEEVRVEVDGITMVVTRLFEIDTVRLNVTRQLLQQNVLRGVAPTTRVSKLRQ
jgi:hypothetical protein